MRGRSQDTAPGHRLLRVGENVRHALADILARDLVRDDALVGSSITVTEARVSPDLRNASIFVMPLGGDQDGKIVKALNKHAGFLRGEMSKRVTMKYMPKLKFELDASFDEASHINSLLRSDRVAKDITGGDD